jgi:hypothetical protein
MVACAIALTAVAMLEFARGSAWPAFRHGGPGMYWVLVAGVIGLVVFIALAWRGPVRTGWWVACFALPQIAAVASSFWFGRNLDAALEGMVGDIVPRILAEGTAELTLAMTLADLFTVACAATIAIGLGSSLTPSDDARPSAKRVLVPGGLWVAASIVFFVHAAVRHRDLGLQWVVSPLVVAMVAVAVLSRGPHELAHRVAVVAVLGVFLLDRAIALRAKSSAFGELSMEGMRPLDQARFLADFIDVRREGAIAAVVHFILGAATFFTAYGLPRRSMMPAGVVLILVAALSARERRAFSRRMETAKAAFDVGVPIPSTSAKNGWSLSGDRFVVTRTGALTDVVTERPEEVEAPVPDEGFSPPSRNAKAVFADIDLGCGALVAALQPKVRARQAFALAAVHTRLDGPRPFVGDLEPLVGDRELVGLGFDVGHRHYPVIEAILASDSIELKLPGETLAFALNVDPEEVAHAVTARRPGTLPRRDTVELAVHASDSVRRLAMALTILTVAFPMDETWQHRYFALRVE